MLTHTMHIRSRRVLRLSWRAMAGWAVLLTLSATVGAQVAPPTADPFCETDSSWRLEHKAPVVRDARSVAIHEARERGDLEALAQLQQARPGTLSGGEAAGPIVLTPSTTRGFAGTPFGMDLGPGGGPPTPPGAASIPGFGGDVHIRPSNLPDGVSGHTLASDSAGNLYVAWEDDGLGYHYIQTYKSDDDGASWTPFGYVLNSSADLMQPSIAVGEGSSGNTVLIAYIMDDGVGTPVPEVATASLSGGTFTPHSVPVYGSWESWASPVIITDSVDWSGWFAYLTTEAVVNSSTNNVNICTWRSTDGGSTWTDLTPVCGNSDPYQWMDPDITYGTTQNDVYLVCYQKDDNSLHFLASTDLGQTWSLPSVLKPLSLLPNNGADPEIAAAINHDNIMVACTNYNGSAPHGDGVWYTFTSNLGASWSSFYRMYNLTDRDEFAVSLIAGEGGQSWHLAYTSGQDHSIKYHSRPQDLSDYWTFYPLVIDDMRAAGSFGDYSKKGIAANWTSDVATVVWADSRDNVPGDYDSKADFMGNTGLMLDNTLITLSDGGTVNFTLDAGPANAGRRFMMLGSITGTAGFPLPGGNVTMPLTWDFVTVLTISVGPPSLMNFRGTLDIYGQATATMNVPPITPGAYVNMYFAFALNRPWDHASNAVAVSFEP